MSAAAARRSALALTPRSHRAGRPTAQRSLAEELQALAKPAAGPPAEELTKSALAEHSVRAAGAHARLTRTRSEDGGAQPSRGAARTAPRAERRMRHAPRRRRCARHMVPPSLSRFLSEAEAELQGDKRVLDSLQRRVVAVNRQISQPDEFMEPTLTDEAKQLLSEHQAVLARELKESLDKHSAAGAAAL